MATSAGWCGSVEIPAQVGGAFSVPVSSLKESRFRTTARQQYDFSCGSAALSTLLTHHYGIKVSEQTVFEQMYRVGNQAKIRQQGFSLLDMKRYLDARGIRADGFQVGLDEIESAGVPGIALVNMGMLE